MQKPEYGYENHKARSQEWFSQLRDEICQTLENLEKSIVGVNNSPPGHFKRESWKRANMDQEEGGGGTMATLRGRVFEKAGVNISTVYGQFSEDFKEKIPGASEDPRFWATGISVVIHPISPLVPAIHMNTRMIATTECWFGGGTDLTPVFPKEEETKLFHQALQAACNKHDATYYPKFKDWCDEYFFLPHRNEARGVGGIFFDNLNTGNWEKDFNFVKDVGSVFKDIYPVLVNRVAHLPWDESQRKAQIEKRGRYVEFNLLYDRGTLFGLKTGGNVEAILMSLPPMVSWP